MTGGLHDVTPNNQERKMGVSVFPVQPSGFVFGGGQNLAFGVVPACVLFEERLFVCL